MYTQRHGFSQEIAFQGKPACSIFQNIIEKLLQNIKRVRHNLNDINVSVSTPNNSKVLLFQPEVNI